MALPWRSPNTWISMWRGSAMARSRITVGIAERALRFRPRAAQRIRKRRRIRDQPHAAPAAAGDRLDHDGKADLAGLGQHDGVALVGALIAGHAGHAGRQHDLLGAGLVAHRLDGFRRRPDEHQPGIAARLREILVLGEKAVAGMHRVGAAGLGRRDDRLDLQVGLRRQRLADPDGFDRPRAHAAHRGRRRNRPRPRHSRGGARCA